MNPDFHDMLRALRTAGVQFLIVGAHALSAHGIVRATGDLDLWIRISPANALALMQALDEFGAPVAALGLSAQDFLQPGRVIQIGLPPRRIDLLTSVTGLEFDEAWTSRVEIRLDDLVLPMLGREALLTNKRAVGRPQDLADVDALLRQGRE